MKRPDDDSLLNHIARGLLLDEVRAKQQADSSLSVRAAYMQVYQDWALSETAASQLTTSDFWKRMADGLSQHLDQRLTRYCGKRLKEIVDELNIAPLTAAEIERLSASQKKKL